MISVFESLSFQTSTNQWTIEERIYEIETQIGVTKADIGNHFPIFTKIKTNEKNDSTRVTETKRFTKKQISEGFYIFTIRKLCKKIK